MSRAAYRLAVGFATALFALVPAGALATASVALDLDARLERALDVVVGTVRTTRSEAFGLESWTVVTVEVERWLRSEGGDVDDAAALRSARPTLELAFLGGDAPGAPRRTVALMPAFVVGERVLLLTYGADVRYASNLVGFDQGLFRWRDDAWVDVDGAVLGFAGDGTLALGARPDIDVSAADEDVLDALAARLVQLGVRP
jgi:hypothetical protein